MLCTLKSNLALERSSSRIFPEYDFFVSPNLQKKAVWIEVCSESKQGKMVKWWKSKLRLEAKYSMLTCASPPSALSTPRAPPGCAPRHRAPPRGTCPRHVWARTAGDCHVPGHVAGAGTSTWPPVCRPHSWCPEFWLTLTLPSCYNIVLKCNKWSQSQHVMLCQYYSNKTSKTARLFLLMVLVVTFHMVR